MLRRIQTSRLLMLCAAVAVVVAGVAAVAAGAFSGSGPLPAKKNLAVAIHDALAAPPVNGVTADIEFTNHLVDAASLRGASPLITGASGRLWADKDHLRIELKSASDQSGDTQVLVTGNEVSVYDVASKTIYKLALPGGSKKAEQPGRQGGVPTVAEIQRGIDKLAAQLSVPAAPRRGHTGGQKSYTVSFSPRHDGGLLGSAQLGWDAVTGVPLSVAIYAQTDKTPVIKLTATNVSYGPVSPSDLAITPAPGVKTVSVAAPSGAQAAGKHEAKKAAGKHEAKNARIAGLAAVQKAVPFTLSAPPALATLPQQEVRLLDWKGSPAALVTYGKGFGGLAVIEQKADASKPAPQAKGSDSRTQLPTVQINGATGTELASALGTLLRFDRAGVTYTLIGSVTPSTAETAARGL